MPANGSKRIRPGRRLSLRQVLDFQEGAHEMAMGLREDFKAASDGGERARVASALANIGKMWCSTQDSKREILGKPKAGVRKHEVEKKKTKPDRGMWDGPIEFDPSESPTESQKKADDVKWEDREVRPGVREQVVSDSPAIRAAAAAKAEAEAKQAPEVQGWQPFGAASPTSNASPPAEIQTPTPCPALGSQPRYNPRGANQDRRVVTQVPVTVRQYGQ
jgi:hypothetical protein